MAICSETHVQTFKLEVAPGQASQF